MKKYDRKIIKRWKMRQQSQSQEEGSDIAPPKDTAAPVASSPDEPVGENTVSSAPHGHLAAIPEEALPYDLRAIRAKRKKRHAALLGGFLIFLSLVGAVTVIQKTVDLVFYFSDSTRDKEMFEQLIRPVVMFDPVPFDSIDAASETSLLQASVWGTLLGQEQKSYDTDETGMLLVPASDLDVTAARLFGPEVKLVHQTFGDIEMTFPYDENKQLYHVPTYGYLGMYTPQVEHITKQNGYTVLKVNYMLPGNVWNFNEKGVLEETDGVAKTRYYVMLQNKSGYYIAAICASDPLHPQDNSSQAPIRE